MRQFPGGRHVMLTRNAVINRGLDFLILSNRSLFENSDVYSVILLTLLFTAVINSALVLFDSKLDRGIRLGCV
jgi:hypothetical protein